MANYFISDLHIGHANVLRFDNRPFADVTAMNDAILERWNRTVTGNDTVYILGDFIWTKEAEWPFILGPMAGKKVLIRGNHDPKQFSSETHRLFCDVKDYLEMADNGRRLILCYYPIPFHKYDFVEDCWMLYGHVHNTREYDMLRHIRKTVKDACTERGHARGNFINTGCMMPWMDFTPRTLDEIIAGDAATADWNFTDSAVPASAAGPTAAP